MYVSAILLAAGEGKRLKTKTSKPLVKINSLPIIAYSLKAFQQSPYVKDIIAVVNAANKKSIVNLIRRHRIKKVRHIVLGGHRRQDSVKNALRTLDSRPGLVLIHDAARPFIDRGIISGCVRTAEKYGAAIAGVPVKDTIKEAKVTSHKLQVTRSLTRDRLWQIQTPQAFRKSLILKAYRQFGSAEVTDDASLVEKLGAKVAVVKSSYSNIKITTPEDLIIAKVIAGKVKV